MAKKLTTPKRVITRATANASNFAAQGNCTGSDSARKIIFVTLLIITTILFVFVLMMIYRSQKQGMQQIIDTEYRGNRDVNMYGEHFGESSPKLVFLYMNGCSWCDKFAPEWTKLENKYANVISLKKIERSDPDAKNYSEHVAGYPTILLEKSDGKIVKFSGQRTVEGIDAFLKENNVNVAEKYTNNKKKTTMSMVGSAIPGFVSSNKRIGSNTKP
jgi:thiol-disulfide isomerase/thioredoxin